MYYIPTYKEIASLRKIEFEFKGKKIRKRREHKGTKELEISLFFPLLVTLLFLGYHSVSTKDIFSVCCIKVTTNFPIFNSIKEVRSSKAMSKDQLILKCPFGVFKSPTKPTKKFPGFLPQPLKRGQIKK